MTIGERIKLRREEIDMSQEELAKMLGYKSRSSINKIELGCNNLTQTKIKAIADALGTTPSYIMGWDEDAAEAAPDVTPEEAALLERFRQMPEEKQRLLLTLAQELS